MSYCNNIQNTNKPDLYSLIQTQIKIVRKIYVLLHFIDSTNKRLVQEIVVLVSHRSSIPRGSAPQPIREQHIAHVTRMNQSESRIVKLA